VTQIELDVRAAGVAFVKAEQSVVAWIALEKASCGRAFVTTTTTSSFYTLAAKQPDS